MACPRMKTLHPTFAVSTLAPSYLEHSLVLPYAYSPSRCLKGQHVPELTTVRVWSRGPWSLTSRCEGRRGRCVEGVDVLPWKSEGMHAPLRTVPME